MLSLRPRHNARYAKLGRQVGKRDRHIFKHTQSQRWHCASSRNNCKIIVRVKNGVINIFCRHRTIWDNCISSLMQIKLPMSHARNKLCAFAWNYYCVGYIKEKTIAVFDLLGTIVKRIQPCIRRIYDIRFASRDVSYFTECCCARVCH